MSLISSMSNMFRMFRYFMITAWTQLCTVRKQALTSLNSLTIDAPTCTILHSLWLDGVMPMVMDEEISVQERCFLLLEEFLLSLISPYTDLPSEMEKFLW
ncbi:condensin-2 complex subunit D3-L-like isoform X2 [Dysidea avara]|uniref:condensin-2 complex subunit D3-L-like isoform X2 n=1 Tax=Dysidea avara TaxID=196820 RepID=UPI00332BD186